MKLTEREKYLMQISWYAAESHIHSTMDEWLRESIASLTQEKVIAHNVNKEFPSIVKKVDPDNLPEGEVLAISKDREFLFGHLCSGKSVCENEYFFWCESLDDAVYDITHYIEQKDLIKMISEV